MSNLISKLPTGYIELMVYGIVLNMIGIGLLMLKAILDKNVVEAMIEKRFEEAG